MMETFRENPDSASMAEQFYEESKVEAREALISRFGPRFQEKLKHHKSKDARR
jgi:hypothetical protein